MSDLVTTDQLEAVLSKRKNGRECRDLFVGATEDNRRKLAPTAIAWYRAIQIACSGRSGKSKVVLPE
ncbi:MAG: hypothetical protein KDA85_00365, partial [Planctomycetaceae bacterium]|nr:hypothetical protein [Planctomycetaceae bacterium]